MKRWWIKYLAGWRDLARAIHSNSSKYMAAEMERLTEGLAEIRKAADSASGNIIPAPDQRGCPCCGGKRCWAWRHSAHKVGCGGHNEGDNCKHHQAGRDGDCGESVVSGCGGEPEPLLVGNWTWNTVENAVLHPGKHTPRLALTNWVPSGWSPYPLRLRVLTWPSKWERALGRPIRLGTFRQFVSP